MREAKNIEIKEMKFQLNPMPALKALRLDKKILSLLTPLMGGIKSLDVDKALDLKVMADSISEAVQNLGDAEWEKLVLDFLSEVTYTGKGGTMASDLLDNTSTINNVFSEDFTFIYKLIFEVMKYNKFSPFKLVGGGFGIEKILTSLNPTKVQKKSGS